MAKMFHFNGQKNFYQGKVRDVYEIEGGLLVIVASDRISAFDHILPRTIPFKGAVLNSMAAFFLEKTRHIIPNWLLDCPFPHVSIGYRCEPIRVEMIVRGHLCGHAWRLYKSGRRTICGATVPDGLREADPLPSPIITPSTKAPHGHDEDITPDQIVERGLVSGDVYEKMEKAALALFQFGQEHARKQGLILADTKYEFGLWQGQLMLIDEIHTPDSSRYFYLDGFTERQQRGEPQEQLSKEFVREWLMAHGFMGRPGESIPAMDDDLVEHISKRYILLYELVTGQPFVPFTYPDEETLQQKVNQQLEHFRKI
ncbi:MAG: phosphoribosylaminoimidazolesuccinocarboxamide synthase [Flavobacteriales bacterium]|nr:phosphoribosylaminoimidazolesuccinocarboxamide synthase [Flavobacteriales bacterium]MCX7768213.1 phosphoribosylaminoimidazolesuccinocarboxamide synthase [Flavobacteriales bacterium]MDW8409164.1 phosphoribosylaminoimidazolesuccinocarboxamide synthase [Flavobacteriales bacterium]